MVGEARERVNGSLPMVPFICSSSKSEDKEFFKTTEGLLVVWTNRLKACRPIGQERSDVPAGRGCVGRIRVNSERDVPAGRKAVRRL